MSDDTHSANAESPTTASGDPSNGHPNDGLDGRVDDNEPRAGAVIRGQADPEELDPALVEQLAAWFGSPAEEDANLSRQERAQIAFTKERKRIHEHVAASTDPGFLAKLEFWTQDADNNIRLPEPPRMLLEMPITKFDLEVWGLPTVELRQVERPAEITDSLQENVPQALLRDLHRPEIEFGKHLYEQDIGVDIAGAGVMREIHELAVTKYRVRIQEEVTAFKHGRRELDEMRQRYDEPWEEIEIPEERRSAKASLEPGPEDFKWFAGL